MRKVSKQSGFAFLELVLIIVIIGALVVIGMWVYGQHKSKNDTASNGTALNSTQSPVAQNVSQAPSIGSASDLNTALSTLNQNDPATANSSDQNQLDAQTSF